MDIEERMREVIRCTGITSKALEQKTGIDRDRWSNLRRSKPSVKVRAEEIEWLIKIFPEYAYWIATGLEIPEAGQISPATKEVQDRLNIKVA